jgi:hypothetical protein
LNIYAYCALHYGAQWLEFAIRSVLPLVDSYHIFYTPHPSHGSQTNMTMPEGEDRDSLRAIAGIFGDQVIWHDEPRFWQEGPQRDNAVEYLAKQGADLIVWNDADEVWDLDVLSAAIDFAVEGTARDYRTRAIHFWKGVNWVCMDDCMPVRLIKPSGHGEAYVPGMGFYHFGYAQSEMIVLYKSKIHGHRGEWRKNWFSEIYEDWKPGKVYKCGVHPTNECDDKTGKPFWTPIPFNRADIEHLIGDHPYYSDEIV